MFTNRERTLRTMKQIHKWRRFLSRPRVAFMLQICALSTVPVLTMKPASLAGPGSQNAPVLLKAEEPLVYHVKSRIRLSKSDSMRKVQFSFEPSENGDDIIKIQNMTQENETRGDPVTAIIKKIRYSRADSDKGYKMLLKSTGTNGCFDITFDRYFEADPEFPGDIADFLEAAAKRHLTRHIDGFYGETPCLRPLETNDFNREPRYAIMDDGTKRVTEWPTKFSYYSKNLQKGQKSKKTDVNHVENKGKFLSVDESILKEKSLSDEEIVWGSDVKPTPADIIQSEDGPKQTKYGSSLGDCAHLSVLSSLSSTKEGRAIIQNLLTRTECGKWIVTLNLPTEKIEVEVELALRDVILKGRKRTMRTKWTPDTTQDGKVVGIWPELILQGLAKYLGGYDKVHGAEFNYLMFLYTGFPTTTYTSNGFEADTIPTSGAQLAEHFQRPCAMALGAKGHARAVLQVLPEADKWIMTGFCPYNNDRKVKSTTRKLGGTNDSVSCCAPDEEHPYYHFKGDYDEIKPQLTLVTVCYLDETRTLDPSTDTFITNDYGVDQIYRVTCTSAERTSIRIGVTQEVYRASAIHGDCQFRGLAFGTVMKDGEPNSGLTVRTLGTESGVCDYKSPVGFTKEIELVPGQEYYLVPFKDNKDKINRLSSEIMFFRDESVRIEPIMIPAGNIPLVDFETNDLPNLKENDKFEMDLRGAIMDNVRVYPSSL